MGSTSRAGTADLRARLEQVTLVDAHRLGRRLERLTHSREDAGQARRLAAFTRDLERAETLLARRQGHRLDLAVPEHLPISAHTEQIAAAIRDHQVVVVAGETGSGKTTQLPKICLELGRGRARPDRPHPAAPDRRAHRGRADRRGAGHRRWASAVGYKVRFTDQVRRRHAGQADDRRHPAGRDRSATGSCARYDTIIIDEAHERSLNIDFLLGYLKRLLPAPARPQGRSSPRRPSTRERFAAALRSDGAPVVEVSGRTYPVEVRYRPLSRTPARTQDGEPHGTRCQAIVDAVEELSREGPATSWCSCPASGRSATPPRR